MGELIGIYRTFGLRTAIRQGAYRVVQIWDKALSLGDRCSHE